MARSLHIEYPGAFYHVLNLGQWQDVIVEDVREWVKATFLSWICGAPEIRSLRPLNEDKAGQ